MKCSNIVGTVGKEEKLFKVINGEKFFEREITINGDSFPIVASEYIIPEHSGPQKYRLECYIRSEGRDNKLYTFIQACQVEPVEDSTPDDGTVKIGGWVRRVCPPITVHSNGKYIFTFVVQYKSFDGNINTANCVAIERAARMLKDKFVAKDLVELTGTLKRSQASFEISINTLDLCNSKEEGEKK